MKYETLISILFLLLSRKRVTARYLAERFQISIRTVYRYITTIELSNVPIYVTYGKNGGYSIADTYRLPSGFFTEAEYKIVLQSLKAIESELPNKELLSAIEKISSNIKNEKSGFKLDSGTLIIDGGAWGDTVGHKNKMKIIENCIANKSLLVICYRDRDGKESVREIEPHCLVLKQGLWYVYAYCRLRKEFRLFKTGRIYEARILEEKFERREVGEPNLPSSNWFASEVVEVEFELKERVRSEIEEWLGVENVTKMSDRTVAIAKLPFDNGLISKILSYGDGLKVVRPVSLKNKLVKQCENIINAYS